MNLGRPLESYAVVLRELQAVWTESGVSMGKMQALLLGNSEPSMGFDLPAYLHLLLLYGVARDHFEHKVFGDEIDLLLPLDVDTAGPAPSARWT